MLPTLHRLIVLICIGLCLPALVTAQADKPKPQLLDGELIEPGQPAPAPPPAQPAPGNNTSQTVTLLKEFTVTLPVTPASGFSWRLVSHDRQFLQFLRNRYQKPDPPRPGATGQQRFDFLPLKSGTTSIIFHYQRPLEKQVAQEMLHTVIIK